MSRPLLALLGLVATAAAVLSFDALLGLAITCGFRPALAWLLPVTVDAGAAAGSLVWLASYPGHARRFGRALALALLTGSVAGNALSHGLDAYAARPAWWVVVAVSAVPPAVLGAVVHLAVLARRAAGDPVDDDIDDEPRSDDAVDWWAAAPPADETDGTDDLDEPTDRTAELIASGAGRRRLARELDISEHAARELLAGRRNGHQEVAQ